MKEKYKVIRKLGVGATAEVFLAEEISTGMVYAMKISEKEDLLKKEALILNKLQGNCFPGFKEYKGNSLVMEYVEGKDLQQLMDMGRQFSLGETVYIIEEVLRTLNKLHRQEISIIYRDLKPANIMIGPNGKIKLIDFGAAYCKEEAIYLLTVCLLTVPSNLFP